MATGLSVTVITLNEERNLGRCLESVKGLADEVVVVDSGSTDRTEAIAREAGATFVVNPWPGYERQKNFAVERSTMPWILSLDADEWLPAETREELRAVLAGEAADGYELNRKSTFLGGYVRCWSPDWNVRLFRRGRGRFGSLGAQEVHERVCMEPGASVRRLRGPFWHEPYRSLEQYVTRLNQYTTTAARGLHARGRPFRAHKLLFSPPVMFLRMYLLRGGLLDGWRGFILSLSSGFYVLMKYAKLWWLERSGGQDADEVPSEHRSRTPGKRG